MTQREFLSHVGCCPFSRTKKHPSVTSGDSLTLGDPASSHSSQITTRQTRTHDGQLLKAHRAAWLQPRQPGLDNPISPINKPDAFFRQMAWPGFRFGKSGQEEAADSLGSWQGCPAREWQLGRRAEDGRRSACPGYYGGPWRPEQEEWIRREGTKDGQVTRLLCMCV